MVMSNNFKNSLNNETKTENKWCARLAYKCGMYHQLGKALVPPEYQILQNDFTGEERAVYRKYTTEGRILVLYFVILFKAIDINSCLTYGFA